MKKFLAFLFLISLVFAKSPSELFKEINKSKASLEQTTNQKMQINKQLQQIAAKIEKTKAQIEKYNQKLNQLDQDLVQKQKKYNEAMAEIKSINNAIKALDQDISAKNQEFAKKIAQSLGIIVAKSQGGEEDEKSVILRQFYEKYKSYNQKQILKLSRNIEQKNQLKKALLKKKNEILASISDVKKQKKIYQQKKKERQKLLAKLHQEEKIYAKKLKELIKRQIAIRLTLSKLNILHQDAVRAAKEKEAMLKKRIQELKRLRLQQKRAREAAAKAGRSVKYSLVSVPKVKEYASSYMASNITSYNGLKTIPPLKAPEVIKNFGSFIDPIYHIKSFSDSITLVTTSSDKRVFNVLNGEVEYIGKNPMLGKMVIVKHANNVHTIYADLDRISPLIRVGSKIQKGAVIGKIKRKLIFEATKNGKFINPRRLISL